jgi:hypothetical protein
MITRWAGPNHLWQTELSARGKLDAAGREITREAHLTDRAAASCLKYHSGIATGRGCGVAGGRTLTSSLQQVTERKVRP